jgi:hypothetical protein
MYGQSGVKDIVRRRSQGNEEDTMPLLGGNASPSEFFRPGGNASVATPQKLQKVQTLPQTSEASRDQDLEETRSIGASSHHADEPEELSKDEVQMIKARTMFQMVEDIQSSGGSAKKLLFLTNAQAEYLSSSQQTLVKMLDALELPKPKLVINILMSQGFRANTDIQGDRPFACEKQEAGLVNHRPAFLSLEEERAAEGKIERFMADVLLPLAAQTNAIVLCSADPSSCVLSAALTRVFGLLRAKWGAKPPFTLISVFGSVHNLYRNSDLNASWREMRKLSRSWRQRDRMLTEMVARQYTGPDGEITFRDQDLDPNATVLLVVDGINTKKMKCADKTSYNKLVTELVRHLAGTLPSLSMKTGNSDKGTLSEAFSSSLAMAMDSACSGTPLLLLDARTRPFLVASDRASLIEAAKEACSAIGDSLFQAGLCETFDTCTVSFFHKVLFEDGMKLIQTTNVRDAADTLLKRLKPAMVPLHEAISFAKEGLSTQARNNEQRFKPPSAHQIHEVCASHLFSPRYSLMRPAPHAPCARRCASHGASICSRHLPCGCLDATGGRMDRRQVLSRRVAASPRS